MIPAPPDELDELMATLFPEIRPHERRQALGVFAVLFGITAGHALVETARDALFLASLPPARLAWVYLAIAVLTLGLFVLQERFRGRRRRAGLAAWLAASAVVNLCFWWWVSRPGAIALFALYVWSGVFASLVILRYWSLVGELFTISQAKRLFAFVGAGGVLGAIAGSGLAGIIAAGLDARHILVASAAILLLTAAATRYLLLPLSEADPGDPALAAVVPIDRYELLRPALAIWDRPYLRRVGAIVLVSAVTFTLIDYLFKSAVAAAIPGPSLAAFFASTNFAFNVLSLVAQLLVVGWMLRALSVNRVLSVLPALVFVGTTGLLLGGGVVAALVMKGFDGALRHSLHRTAIQVLYVPIGGDARSRIKGLIDVLGQRGGQALASLVILGSAAVSDGGHVAMVAVLLLTALWVRIAFNLESHYLEMFRETLRGVAVQPRFDFPELDLASLETLLTSLNSGDDGEVVAALDLFAEEKRLHLVPALLLYHPSRVVVLRALELFTLAGRQDFRAILERLLVHDDPEVRAAALRSHSWTVGPRQELYERFAADPAPVVRASAQVGLVSYGAGAAQDSARSAIEAVATGGSRDERLALANAIRYSPGAGYESCLSALAETTDTDLRLAVVHAMREILSASFIPILIAWLPVRPLRIEARATLLAIGTDALRALDEVVGDGAAPLDQRQQAARTIAFFPPALACPILLRHLAAEPEAAVEYRILRALGRARKIDPEVPLDDVALRARLERTLHAAFALVDRRWSLQAGEAHDPAIATPVHELLVDLIRHREIHALERLFRLIGLLHPGEDSRTLHRGVRSRSRKVRDSSRELLEHLLEPPLRAAVLALVDDVDDATRLAGAGSYYTPRRLGYEAVLATLLTDGDRGLRCVTARQVGELGLRPLIPELIRLESAGDPIVRHAARTALRQLGEGGTDGP